MRCCRHEHASRPLPWSWYGSDRRTFPPTVTGGTGRRGCTSHVVRPRRRPRCRGTADRGGHGQQGQHRGPRPRGRRDPPTGDRGAGGAARRCHSPPLVGDLCPKAQGQRLFRPARARVEIAYVEPGATRTHLLAVAAQLRLAAQGRDVLAQKRDALLREFRRSADVVLADSGALERSAAEAATRLGWAEALDGPERLRSAAVAAAGEVVLDVGSVSVMGVEVPQIDRKPVGRPRDGRGFALSTTSSRVDGVAEAFEVELDRLLDVAAAELRV